MRFKEYGGVSSWAETASGRRGVIKTLAADRVRIRTTLSGL